MFDFRKETRRTKRQSLYVASCNGKTKYNTKGAAIERIKHQNKTRRFRRTGGWGSVLAPYRCEYCHHWHVGATDRGDYR